MFVNGVVHVHTKYSRDGKLSLHELKEKCRNEGIKFVFISDHTEDLDPFQYDILKQECEELSSELLCFVPGLEFDCLEGIHILGFNLPEYIVKWNRRNIVEKVRKSGGISVLAHPSRIKNMEGLNEIGALDLVEYWNPTYATEFYPDNKSKEVYKFMLKKNKNVLSIAGTDFHHNGYGSFNKKVYVTLNVEIVSRENIFQKIKEGDYFSTNGFITLHSKGAKIEGNFIVKILSKIVSFSKKRAKKVMNKIRKMEKIGVGNE